VTPGATLLVVEAERDRGQRLAGQLAAEGYRVELARRLEHARILAAARRPALVVLGGVEAPGGALGLLREIRAAADEGPWRGDPGVIVLAGAREPPELLHAFAAGADDFLEVDRGYAELRARVEAVLRRSDAYLAPVGTLVVGELSIDVPAHTAAIDGEPLSLRRLEFELAAHLARAPARVFSRGELLAAVWGYRTPGSTRTLETHASRLRRKLRAASAREWVINVRGVGYRLV